MQFEREYIIGAREIGLKNQITNYGILALLEDIAGMHSDTVGYGVKDIEEKKKAWVLMDWQLKVLKRPGYGKKLLLKTWARTMNKLQFHTYRDFEVYDENNSLVAIATSKWAFVDVERGKISKIEEDLINLYNPDSKQVFENPDIEKLKIPENYNSVIEYKTKRADIDVNNHMHNLNYLSLAYEALPDDVYYGEELSYVRVTCKHQIRLGDKVKCYYTYENSVHTVVIKSEDDKIIHSIIELRK